MVYQDWLVEEGTYGILHRLLDKADRGLHRVQLVVNPKQCPELFENVHEETAEAIWSDLQQLQSEADYLRIRLSKAARFQTDFENATIEINDDKLERMRLWLDRPVFSPEQLIWDQTVERFADKFEDGGLALKRQPLCCEGKTPKDIVAGFAKISECIDHPTTMRQISAQCFWGDSKFLDHREHLVADLFPSKTRNIKPRPLLMNVFLPQTFSQVLFIENQDSFLMLAGKKPEKTALIYLGGFRGTALRIRENNEVVFSYINTESTTDSREHFQKYWLGNDIEHSVESYYWGDLDYAGMAILASLRYVFPNVTAWAPGYNVMLDILKNGGGHAAGVGGQKSQQVCPDMTGCAFADNILLPLLEEHDRFLDQEVVSDHLLDCEL